MFKNTKTVIAGETIYYGQFVKLDNNIATIDHNVDLKNHWAVSENPMKPLDRNCAVKYKGEKVEVTHFKQ